MEIKILAHFYFNANLCNAHVRKVRLIENMKSMKSLKNACKETLSFLLLLWNFTSFLCIYLSRMLLKLNILIGDCHDTISIKWLLLQEFMKLE